MRDDAEKIQRTSQTLDGLLSREFYRTKSKEDPAFLSLAAALQEVAAELGFSLSEPIPEVLDALSAAEKSGKDVLNLPGREVWRLTLQYEQPQA